TSGDDPRRLLLVYLARINELADRPEFYHLLTNRCTINIVRYANAAGREGRFDIRHLLNGLVDGYLYHSGWVDTTLPFDELRRRSLINAAAQAADWRARFLPAHSCLSADCLSLTPRAVSSFSFDWPASLSMMAATSTRGCHLRRMM